MTDVTLTWTASASASQTPRRFVSMAPEGDRVAVVATCAAVAMLPVLRHGSPGNVAPVDALIALAIGSCLMWAGTTRHRWRFPYVVPMALLMAGGVLGAIAGPVPRTGITAVVQDAVLVVWCWAVVNLASSPDRLRAVLGAWAWSAVAWVMALFLGLLAGVSALTGQTPSEGSRTALTFGDPNYSASFYVISLMIIWATGVPRRRPIRVAAYVLLIAAIASTGSNSGILSLCVAIGVAAILAVERRAGAAAAIAASCLVVGGGVLTASQISVADVQRDAHASPYAFLRDGVGRGAKSAAQRGTLRQETARLYRESGPLGAGPVSTKTRLETSMAPYVKEAHNDYLAALIERGVVGAGGMALLVAVLGFRLSALRRGRLADRFAAAVPHRHALVGAVAGTLVAMAVYELLHVRHVWALLAIVAALHLWGRR